MMACSSKKPAGTIALDTHATTTELTGERLILRDSLPNLTLVTQMKLFDSE